jgi:adhesin/invasin
MEQSGELPMYASNNLLTSRLRRATLCAITLCAATLAACSSDSTDDTQPKLISGFSGEGQTGTAGGAVTNPLVVRVIDGSGHAVSGATVTFVATGGATVATSTATTDANGLASTTATLGTKAGVDSITASVSGATIDPQVFTVTVNPGAPAAIAALNGSTQTVNAARGSTVTVGAVVTDQFGNVVPNAVVNFTATGGTVQPVAITDNSGTVAQTIQLPNSAGTVNVTATIDGTPTFTKFTYNVQ